MTTAQHPDPPGADGQESQNGALSALSTEMVGLYKNQFGRGPTRVRSDWAGRDTIVVSLEDTLTPAERNLVKLGEHQRLRDTRLFFQYATVAEFCEPVERLTGRKVRTFVSGIDTEVEGYSIELCIPRATRAPRGSTPPCFRPDDGGDA